MIELRGVIEIEDDVDTVVTLLERADLYEAFQDCRSEILWSVDRNFQQRGSPAGPWPPRKDDKPHPLLEETGALRAAATGHGPGHITVWEERGFSVGVDIGMAPMAAMASQARLGGVPGAGVHQYGFPPIPARPFMVPDADALDECAEIIADSLNRALEGL